MGGRKRTLQGPWKGPERPYGPKAVSLPIREIRPPKSDTNVPAIVLSRHQASQVTVLGYWCAGAVLGNHNEMQQQLQHT